MTHFESPRVPLNARGSHHYQGRCHRVNWGGNVHPTFARGCSEIHAGKREPVALGIGLASLKNAEILLRLMSIQKLKDFQPRGTLPLILD